MRTLTLTLTSEDGRQSVAHKLQVSCAGCTYINHLVPKLWRDLDEVERKKRDDVVKNSLQPTPK